MTAAEANKLAKQYLPLDKRLNYIKCRITNVARRGRFNVSIMANDESDKPIYNAFMNYDDTKKALENEGYTIDFLYKPNYLGPKEIKISWGIESIENNLTNQ